MREEIKTRLTAVFRKVFKDNSIEIQDQTTANDIERWDSLTHLVLIQSAEEEFGIKFKLKELIAMKNVGDFISGIELKLQAK
jgi:acyl carrier protein